MATNVLHSLTVSDITEGFNLVVLWKKDRSHPDLQRFLSIL